MTARLRVVLLSSTTFGLRCLQEGIAPSPEVEVTGVLTTPREIAISYSPGPLRIATWACFEDAARTIGCPLASVSCGRTSEHLATLRRWSPDLILALGWYFKVPRAVRGLARLGAMGIHASLLPRYRGGAPIAWAIIQGESETGVTLFQLEDEVDAGDVLGQVRFPIAPSDTCATVYERATNASIELLRDRLPALARGDAQRAPQDERLATTYPQRSPSDGRIDWSLDARRLRDFIRAQTRPYPGAFFEIEGKRVTIWDADIEELSGHGE